VYTSLPVLRKRSDVKTYWMAVGGACCGWAAMYVLALVNFKVKYEFVGGCQKVLLGCQDALN